MESHYKLTEVPKKKHDYFLFYINLLNEESNKSYINEIFKCPKLPLIGLKNENKNNQNSHLIGKLLSLVMFQINICQGKDNNEIDQDFSDFVLPPNINEYLNIDEVIEIDNNTDEPNVNLFFMPKKKLNFYFIISELPLYSDKSKNKIQNKINNYENDYLDNINFFEDNNLEKNNNSKDNKNNINDLNVIKEEKDPNDNKINIINEENKNLNKINIIEEDKENKNKINVINEDRTYNKFDIGDYDYENYIEEDINEKVYYNDDYQVYNIIPHFFYLEDEEKNLLEIKNLFFNNQITLFTLPEINYNDINNENKEDFIDINNLRAETSNLILVNQNNFKIENDNLKFYLNIKKDFSQFYLIYASDKNEYHSVFYYITCNNEESKNKMINILNKSNTLKDVINEFDKTFGKNKILKNLKKVFGNK